MPLRSDADPICRPCLAVPGFFRACCMEASWGGGRSYRGAGYHLAIHVTELESYAYDDETQFAARLELLAKSLSEGDRKAVLRWFEQEYPNCMTLVPRRRRQLFLDGVFHAFESGRLQVRRREEGGIR